MLIEARAITKAFGSFCAVDDVSIAVEPGIILGLIGPNGAGKSTLFNCLTGDIAPTSGEVLIEGHDVTRLPPEERARRGLARARMTLHAVVEAMPTASSVIVASG